MVYRRRILRGAAAHLRPAMEVQNRPNERSWKIRLMGIGHGVAP
jgi:hypothetical protein